jgi:hypothetical protein
MKVIEMIKKLEKYDDNYEVVIYNGDYNRDFPLYSIKKLKGKETVELV